jgi:FMN phosphatase YigB (HAD superfamily)
MPPVRAVIFDLGHTLWDFAPTDNARRYSVLRLHAALERAHGERTPAPRALDRALGAAVERWLRGWSSERLEQPPSERLVAEALAAFELRCEDGLVRELTRTMFGKEIDMPVIPADSLAAIGALDARGIAMGCVTNTITLEEGISDALARLGLLRYLRSIVASSAVSYRKPHPSLFRRALAELGVAPQDAVFVGDRLVDDIAGAQAAGMRAVLTHQYRQEPLEGATAVPDAVIERLSELPRVVEELGGATTRAALS